LYRPVQVPKFGRSFEDFGRDADRGHKMGRAFQVPNEVVDTAPFAAAPRLDRTWFAPANRRALSGPGLRAFVAIADLWGLNEVDRVIILGLPVHST
jgi:hypothetical protein